VTDSSRLDELRRRVQSDPTSIAFAALADEYRRAGLAQQAVEVCRRGLRRHPAYLSARVTLGRALLELGEFEAARSELEQVLSVAPENLAAIRALDEIGARHGPSVGSLAGVAPSSGFSRGPSRAAARVTDMAIRPEPPGPPALGALHRFLDAIVRLRSHSA
jgi:tetratricopeptide (TPR) repeat protein